MPDTNRDETPRLEEIADHMPQHRHNTIHFLPDYVSHCLDRLITSNRISYLPIGYGHTMQEVVFALLFLRNTHRPMMLMPENLATTIRAVSEASREGVDITGINIPTYDGKVIRVGSGEVIEDKNWPGLINFLHKNPPNVTVVSAYGLTDGMITLSPDKTSGESSTYKDRLIEAAGKLIYLVIHPYKLGREHGIPMRRRNEFNEPEDKVYRVVTYYDPSFPEADRRKFLASLDELCRGIDSGFPDRIQGLASRYNGPVIVEFDIAPEPDSPGIHSYRFKEARDLILVKESKDPDSICRYEYQCLHNPHRTPWYVRVIARFKKLGTPLNT